LFLKRLQPDQKSIRRQVCASFGANMFVQPHGFLSTTRAMLGGRQWSLERQGRHRGQVQPTGQVLMTLGKPGMPGNAEGYFRGASSVVVAPHGDILSRRHGNNNQ